MSRFLANVVTLVVVLGLAWWCYETRRALIQSFFVDAAPQHDGMDFPPPPRRVDPEEALVRPVRVLLLDGLGRDHADRLPELAKRCDSGVRMTVDVGFPTVSLPVQHALWTGLTQQQSGVAYRLAALPRPPSGALPWRVRGSWAVAESHAEIVQSFGFERISVQGADPGTTVAGRAMVSGQDEADATMLSLWRTSGFGAAVLEAVASESPLVFVHVLRIDEAGHAHGAGSNAYGQAAGWADKQLSAWVGAAGAGARWLVLSDHGHRAAGGHGGAEAHIRRVRACWFGAVASDPHVHHVALVDLSKLLFDALGLHTTDPTGGQAWADIGSRPVSDLRLPGPSIGNALVSVVILGIAGVILWRTRTCGQSVVSYPCWIIVAAGSVVWLCGQPTLSNPVVYPPLGLAIIGAASPGYGVLLVSLWRKPVASTWGRAVTHLLALPLAFCLVGLTLCGAFAHWVSSGEVSSLMPYWTGMASAALCVTWVAALATGAAVLIATLRARMGASREPKSAHASRCERDPGTRPTTPSKAQH
ncbi:MAG: hypothetical protein V3V08_13070 [Nannocystaceae bacterium]